MGFIVAWVGMLIPFFIIQAVLCLKVRNNLIRFVPAVIIALSYLLAFFMYLGGVLGVFPEGGAFAGAFVALFSSADLVGCLLGWLLYYIVKKIKAKKQKN